MGRTFYSNDKTGDEETIPVKQLREFLKNCDTDGDRRLSREELKVAFRKLGALIPGFRAFEGMFRADGNGDGVIDLDNEEFGTLIKFVNNLGYTMKT